MMPRNYYVVLGVPPGESTEGIRAAYRDLVKRHHPDRAGVVGTARFREVTEAYRVLSDSERRRSYNATLERAEPATPRPAAAASRWPPAEPLAPGPSALSLFDTARPSADEILAGLRQAATGIGSPKGGGGETLTVELLLARDDAVRGTAIRVGVPVPGWCAACGGSGSGAFGRCLACGGEGIVERDTLVTVALPAIFRDTTLEVPLDEAGLRDVVLRLRVRIVPQVAW